MSTAPPRRAPAIAVAVLVTALLVAGCSVGPDEGSRTLTLTVTRDFGADTLLRARRASVPEGETVMRLLQRRAEVETRYGGRFVTAIEGVRSRGGDRRSDWFYYVNGIEADVGAAEREVASGDRIWWDRHEWGVAMRVPAVVGSYPEPFVHGLEGKRFPVRIDCAQDATDVCREVADRAGRAGISPSTSALGAPAGEQLLRFVVGRWQDVRRDAAARQIEQGPAESGVFARAVRRGTVYELDLLDSSGRVVRTLTRGGALVAATRFQEQQPTWVVTGTDWAGLERAAKLLEVRVLRDSFAVAAAGPSAQSLPVTTQAARPR